MNNRSQKPRGYRGHKKRGSDLLPVLTLTLAVAILSALVAGVWQLADPVDYIPPEPKTVSSSSDTSGESSSQDPASQEASSQEQSSEESSPADNGSSTLVGEGEWTASSYFDDALFVGDSITEGIKLYDVMSNATVLSYTGINLDSIFTREVIPMEDGSKKTIIDASADYDPGKIYILMGVNSIQMAKEDFISAYGRLVDTLRQQHPDAIVYVQSILPVTADYEKRADAVTDNATIDEYNEALMAMAEEKGVYYLNVAEIFKDETGALFSEASPTDGIHFGATWYRKWFDYLRTHAVSQ